MVPSLCFLEKTRDLGGGRIGTIPKRTKNMSRMFQISLDQRCLLFSPCSVRHRGTLPLEMWNWVDLKPHTLPQSPQYSKYDLSSSTLEPLDKHILSPLRSTELEWAEWSPLNSPSGCLWYPLQLTEPCKNSSTWACDAPAKGQRFNPDGHKLHWDVNATFLFNKCVKEQWMGLGKNEGKHTGKKPMFYLPLYLPFEIPSLAYLKIYNDTISTTFLLVPAWQ